MMEHGHVNDIDVVTKKKVLIKIEALEHRKNLRRKTTVSVERFTRCVIRLSS